MTLPNTTTETTETTTWRGDSGSTEADRAFAALLAATEASEARARAENYPSDWEGPPHYGERMAEARARAEAYPSLEGAPTYGMRRARRQRPTIAESPLECPRCGGPLLNYSPSGQGTWACDACQIWGDE